MTGDTLREATRKIAATARRQLETHPSPEELISYRAGDLSSAAEARLQDHLALCPECTATVLDLAAFPEVDLRPESPGLEERLVPEWRSVFEELQKGKSGPAVRRGSPPWREKLFLALAAGFFLAVLALSYRVHILERRLVEGELARADLPLFTLTADGETRARGEERLPVSGSRFNLALFLPNPGTYDRYALEAISMKNPAEGTVAWRLEDLAPTSEGIFLVVGLSRRELPPGPYELRLYGGHDPHRARLAEYRVLIEYN